MGKDSKVPSGRIGFGIPPEALSNPFLLKTTFTVKNNGQYYRLPINSVITNTISPEYKPSTISTLQFADP